MELSTVLLSLVGIIVAIGLYLILSNKKVESDIVEPATIKKVPKVLKIESSNGRMRTYSAEHRRGSGRYIEDYDFFDSYGDLLNFEANLELINLLFESFDGDGYIYFDENAEISDQIVEQDVVEETQSSYLDTVVVMEAATIEEASIEEEIAQDIVTEIASPETSYEAPEPSYSAPEPSYSAPEPYSAPESSSSCASSSSSSSSSSCSSSSDSGSSSSSCGSSCGGGD